MKIIKESIKDLSDELDNILTQMDGCNYVVSGELITFDYEGSEQNLNIESLKDIYLKLPQKNTLDLKKSDSKYNYIDGEINPSNWNDAVNEINNDLKYAPYGWGEIKAEDIGLDFVDNSEFEKRKKIFWDLVQKYFKLPATFIYKHKDYYPSYFSFYVMWGFCYIFLKNGKGLILHAGASD